MNDLEATRLCAQAIGESRWTEYAPTIGSALRLPDNTIYDPLHDDAQAMALVKRFRLRIKSFKDALWEASTDPREDAPQDFVHADLNRAIVYCVAAMQAALRPATKGAKSA